MHKRSRAARLAALGAVIALLLPLAAVEALAQGTPAQRSTGLAMEVVNARGEFAKRLHGATAPTGPGWRTVMDSGRRLQLQLPENWKVELGGDTDQVIRAVPPAGTTAGRTGREAGARAQLLVVLTRPRDADPLAVDEALARDFADAVAEEPVLKKLQFRVTDSGLARLGDMSFALAGGTFVRSDRRGKETLVQQQLLYLSEDRLVSIQFSALAEDFPRLAPDVARIFASYRNVGMEREADE